MKKKNKKYIIIIMLFLLLFIGTNIAYAATTSKIRFCEQPGVLRTMQIIGLIIGIVKVAVPVIIIATSFVTFSKVIISGKSEDMKESATTLLKKIVAGIIIFLIPDLVHVVFNNIVNANSTSGFTACETCLNKPKACSIPTEAPSIYTE